MPVNDTAQKQLFTCVCKLMGNRFELTVVAQEEGWALERISEAIAEISRIEQLLTTYNEDSQTALINRNAGVQPVQVDREVFALIERSIKISVLTQGAFDLSYGSLDKRFWNFDTAMTSLPGRGTARRMVRLINYKNIILNCEQRTVFLQEKGMRIGFGGIGKGYAADRARAVMQQHGVQSGVVNASGDLVTWGLQADGKPWTVGIADPEKKQLPFSSLQISDRAVATSGDYEKFAVIDGRKYAHTIDPATGFPVSGIKSATIICGAAELADALTTPLMVMGIRAGLYLINQLKGVACIMIDEHDRLYTSKNIKLH